MKKISIKSVKPMLDNLNSKNHTNVDPYMKYLHKANDLYRYCDTRHELIKHELGDEFDAYEANPFSMCKISHEERIKLLKLLENRICKANKDLAQLAEITMSPPNKNPFEAFATEYKLTTEEKHLILFMYFRELQYGHETASGRHLLFLLGYKPWQFIEKSRILERLLDRDIIRVIGSRNEKLLVNAGYYLTREALQELIDDQQSLDTNMDVEETEDPVLGPPEKNVMAHSVLDIRAPIMSFAQLSIDNDKRQEIDRLIYHAKNITTIFNNWGLDKTIKYGRGITMLFYGPPGTGKTATCEAIAHALDKKIGIANYANMIGKWVGESEKSLSAAFDIAKKNDCVLVFDEADALFATRFQETYSTDRMHNYLTTILMQKIEKFDGIIILTTNRQVVLDEAFERRILLKMKFDIPSAAERTKIWRLLIPAETPLAQDVDLEELGRKFTMTGGEIKNAILNAAIDCVSQGLSHVTKAALTEYAMRESESLQSRKNRRPMGFAPCQQKFVAQ